ncbi:MAG TPA: hypothetical protein VKV15_27935 [Bryobacteraceae bacterium]|nr:hypothetical protein [Bryobacteraceae bacterium]
MKSVARLAPFALGLAVLVPVSFGQNNCQQIKATFSEVFSGGCCTTGTITQGGFLNGTTTTANFSSADPTPDPTTVSYTGELTLTTGQGQLKVKNVYLYNSPTGQGTAIGHIDPTASTGRFAGATGVVFFNTNKTIGGFPISFEQDVSGQICLAQ